MTNKELTDAIGGMDVVTKFGVNDPALSGGSLADGDYFPLYDISEALKVNTTWGNIKNKIKASADNTPTQSSTNLVTSGGVYTYIDTVITQALTGSY